MGDAEWLDEEKGEFLVRLARDAVTRFLSEGIVMDVPANTPKELMRPMGVFVTIESIGRSREGTVKELRGCIGFPLPVKPLAKATIEAAISAAVEDPRFPPITYSELDNVTFEVSVLTPPVEIEVKSPKEYPSKIVIGRDGLIVERGVFKGLLLPQVAVEYGWDSLTFLAEACMKAGLPPDAWALEGTRIYKFQAIIFSEVEPKGRVVKRNLLEELEKKL